MAPGVKVGNLNDISMPETRSRFAESALNLLSQKSMAVKLRHSGVALPDQGNQEEKCCNSLTSPDRHWGHLRTSQPGSKVFLLYGPAIEKTVRTKKARCSQKGPPKLMVILRYSKLASKEMVAPPKP